MSRRMFSRFGLRLTLACVVVLAIAQASLLGEEAAKEVVDATTLEHKVLCGYQGWFRCPGDPADIGWRHWSRNGQRISPESVTVEMWPDMSEYSAGEKYAASGFTHADGSSAHLFSSANPVTVDRHFHWMQEYGIDGVFLQRFLVELRNPSLDLVLKQVRESAKKSGRAYAIGYDLSGMRTERMFDTLVSDWKRLVDSEGIARDKQYLHHNGKPVLFVWGFYSDRFDAKLAQRIVEFFKNDPKYGVTLIGGCQWYWRNERDAEWAKVFRQFDVISPWNVGNTERIQGQKQAATHYWKEDLAAAKAANMAYLPVIYPGFGWTRLKGKQATDANIPRLKGEFFWRQFAITRELKIPMAYVAMFDEVDEGTAIFKVTNDPPVQGPFQTYEGLPSDWYLRLTGEGTRMIRGETPLMPDIPIRP